MNLRTLIRYTLIRREGERLGRSFLAVSDAYGHPLHAMPHTREQRKRLRRLRACARVLRSLRYSHLTH